MPVFDRLSHPYCKTTASRSSWRLAEICLSFPVCHSLPFIPDVKLLLKNLMVSLGLWGAHLSLSTASKMCQTSNHPPGSYVVKQIYKTDPLDRLVPSLQSSSCLQSQPASSIKAPWLYEFSIRDHNNKMQFAISSSCVVYIQDVYSSLPLFLNVWPQSLAININSC